MYFEAYVNAIKAITDRFNQPDFQKYITLQKLIFNAINGEELSPGTQFDQKPLWWWFNYDILEDQLDLLPEIVQIGKLSLIYYPKLFKLVSITQKGW